MGGTGALGLFWAALARWWRRSKPSVLIEPGHVEVKWRVDP